MAQAIKTILKLKKHTRDVYKAQYGRYTFYAVKSKEALSSNRWTGVLKKEGVKEPLFTCEGYSKNSCTYEMVAYYNMWEI